MDVYIDKTQGNPFKHEDNEAMKQGRDLEEYVAKRFMEATRLKVRRSNAMYVNEKYPFMLADVDRLVVGKNMGLECKTASPYTIEKWKDGNVPAHYLAQCYHYMAVFGAEAWYLAVVIYGREFKFIRIERDEEVIENLIRIEEQFWNSHVVPKVLPEPDGSNAADRFINSYFKESRQELTKPLLGFDDKLRRRQEIEEQMTKLETEKKKIEQEVKTYMQDAEFAEDENFLVSWKNSISNRLDTTRLKAEKPDIYKQFCKESRSRRFLVKAV
jgi:putative phage-type endonuclease